MSTPETSETNNTDLAAADPKTSQWDSLPPLEDIQSKKEDGSDQVVYNAAGDDELHL